jgi:hypothetical protein
MTLTDPDGKQLLHSESTEMRFGSLFDDGFACSIFDCPLEWVPTSYGDYTICVSIDGKEFLSEFAIKSCN